LGSVAIAQGRRAPNIVLILADDLGYECLGCNGATEYKTPNLDRFAKSGTRFVNAHSTPLCTPTRVQLMTGKYNFRNYTEFGSLKPGEFTFAHLLQQAGYKTGIAGKWQLAGAIEGTGYKGVGSLPEAAGFPEHCLWQVKARGSRYWDPTLQVDGKLQPIRKGQYGPDIFAAYAENFFEKHRKEPFFFYYAMALTHDPFVPTPDSKDVQADARDKAAAKWFPEMVAYMDKVVGRLLERLESLGLARDTIVIFTGDNGTSTAITTQTVNGPVRGGKGGTKQNGTHVPLIARWTGTTPPGRVCEDLIDFTDFFPTFAEAAGKPMPSEHPKDGQSFLPQIRGGKGKPREWIFCDYAPRWGKFTDARWAMDKRWKLYGDGRLYDVASDPDEQAPVAKRPPEAAKLEKALAKLART
jgi:arylsulfatase A-like enzyme